MSNSHQRRFAALRGPVPRYLPGHLSRHLPQHKPVSGHLAFGWLMLGIVLLAVSSPALAGTEEGAPPHAVTAPKAVVELFTSQGCSSCPPADKLLSQLAQRPDIVALTLAVDYWDYLGWKDTLAKHGHSLRQKAYSKVRGDGKMFTPQAVVSGHAMMVGSDQAALDGAVEAAPKMVAPVAAEVRNGKLVVKIGRGVGSGEVWLCPLISNVAVKIGRGENEGATMNYHNVVRRWIKAGDWSGGEATFEISLDDLRGEGIDAVAVLLQGGSPAAPGPIVGAALQPLD